MPQQESKKNQRVSKAQWLDMALDVMQTDGIAGVRIEGLAKRLSISKSGFYWHFKNRDHLLEDLLDHWFHEATEAIAVDPEMLALKPERRLRKLAEVILDNQLTRHEIPIRHWALQDADAARVVKKVNRLRLDFVGKAFSELGFTGDDLDMRSMLFVCYHTWESSMFRDISSRRRQDLIAKRIELLTSK